MSELTAQIVQQGRSPLLQGALERRKLAKEMRSAREKLTSTVGLERSYEYELVRLFAQYHSGSAILLLVLATVWSLLGMAAALATLVHGGFLSALIGLSRDPLYPGSTVRNLDVAGKDDSGRVAIDFASPADPAAVQAWFRETMTKHGYRVDADGTGLKGSTGEGKPFTLALKAADGGKTDGTLRLEE